MSGHTPGPWFIGHRVLTVISAHDAGDVADVVMMGGRTNAETKANASLITAAPELLEAAKEALAYFERDFGESDSRTRGVADAIAKAEGRTRDEA